MTVADATGYAFDPLFRLGTALHAADRRALFVLITKNASTSLTQTLLPAGFRLTTAFRGRPVPVGVAVFAVIRDPVARWMSALLQYDRTRDGGPPFDVFATLQLSRLREGSFVPLDHHLTPQSTFLLPTMPITRWLRFERLTEDFADVANSLGMSDRLRRHNRTSSAKAHQLASLVSTEDRAAIRRFYADDVSLFERVAVRG